MILDRDNELLLHVCVYSEKVQEHQANTSFNRFFDLISCLSKAEKCEGL